MGVVSHSKYFNEEDTKTNINEFDKREALEGKDLKESSLVGVSKEFLKSKQSNPSFFDGRTFKDREVKILDQSPDGVVAAASGVMGCSASGAFEQEDERFFDESAAKILKATDECAARILKATSATILKVATSATIEERAVGAGIDNLVASGSVSKKKEAFLRSRVQSQFKTFTRRKKVQIKLVAKSQINSMKEHFLETIKAMSKKMRSHKQETREFFTKEELAIELEKKLYNIERAGGGKQASTK